MLLLELPDEAQLLLWAIGVLLSSVLLELHGRLCIQSCHYLLPEIKNTGDRSVRKEIKTMKNFQQSGTDPVDKIHPRNVMMSYK